MTGNLIARLERLERDRPALDPLAALSDDELTVNLLESCAAIVASDCSPEDQAAARATAERVRRDIDGWAAFWKAGGWNGEVDEGRLRPLAGNGIGNTDRDRARHGEMRYRAAAAQNSIACCKGDRLDADKFR
jgi:hypothetical protein